MPLLRILLTIRKHKLLITKDELAALIIMSHIWLFSTMISLQRASDEGAWPLHIDTAEAMPPCMFAAHRYNYGRYGLYYVRSMVGLGLEMLNKFYRGEQLMYHTAGLYNVRVIRLSRRERRKDTDQVALLAPKNIVNERDMDVQFGCDNDHD